MRRIAPIILLSAISLATPSTGAAQNQNAPISNVAKPTAVLSKTVVRITGKIDGVSLPINATGFLVAVPDSRLPAGASFTYLVTNRHVAQAIFPNSEGQPPEAHNILEMEAILNLKEPVDGTRAHSIPLAPKGPTRWYFPEDKSIDLAVTSIPLDDTYDATRIEPGLFFTADVWAKFGIGPGDRVLTCGYFLHYPGAHQFQPIIREGSLAMVPDDIMKVPVGGNARVYLADLHIIPGNSGSPLFLAPASTLGGLVMGANGELPYGLLGIVSGYMWEDNQLTLRAATDYEGTIHANSGIAMIVPVEQLKNLLYSPMLQQDRDIAVINIKKAKP
jgi:hypothetical protein